MIRKLYPNGKKKAFNITYDDGVTQDVRFVELLNKYGVKGTFNLNSELMKNGFEWIHETGLVIKRLSPDVVVDLYKGHEVASHTLTHPYMSDLSEEELMYQMGQDKKNLEELFQREVCGFAVPFDYYSDLIAECAKKCGFSYARTSDERYSYAPPEEYYYWAAGAFHIMPGFAEFVDVFFETDEELALCQIVGHSYDLDTEQMWEQMEEIMQRVAEDKDVISMTNIELVRYLKAMRSAVISESGIENHSDVELWFEEDGRIFSVKPMKNIFVEGIQGMGKTTLVNRIYQEKPELKVCREGDYSPIDLAWCTWMTKAEYESALERYAEIHDEIEKYTVEENGYYVIAYTKIITDMPNFHKDLEQYEIYNGRKDFVQWKEIIFKRFEQFRGTGYLFECAFFQNIMEDLILFHECSDEEITDFYRELFDLIDKKNFRVFYLYSENIEEILQVVKKERSDNAGNEMWYPLMMNYLKDSPYGRKHEIQGFDDMVAHFRHRQMLEMRVIKEVLGECAVVLPAKAWELEDIL